jgi:hypothetical protein
VLWRTPSRSEKTVLAAWERIYANHISENPKYIKNSNNSKINRQLILKMGK